MNKIENKLDEQMQEAPDLRQAKMRQGYIPAPDFK